MHKLRVGNPVFKLLIGSVKKFAGFFFPICFHGFSYCFSQLFSNQSYVVTLQFIPQFHNPNNNNFYIFTLNINNYLGG